MSIPALRSSSLGLFVRLTSVLTFLFLLCGFSLAESHARIVRLSYVDGDVQLDKGDGQGFSTAYLNSPILNHSKLWVRSGQAEVEFEDGSSVRLTPDTILNFEDLSLGSNGDRNSTVELQEGTAYFDIQRRDPDRFQVDFGPDRIQLAMPAHFRIDVDKKQYEVAVFKGEVSVTNFDGSEVAVKKDETIRLDSDDPDRYYLAKGIDAETYDGWDSERTKSHDDVVVAAAKSGYSGNVDGASDLTSYGNYINVPGYGDMWRPAGMGLDWDPFSDGYWVWYPGYGYMFVSDYPWGWAPYRYGSWDFVNGYGWCWNPGSNWNTFYAVPPVRNIPPHFHPPKPPRHRSAPVLVANNGKFTPAPSRRVVIDNDSIQHPHLRSEKIAGTSGEVLQHGSPALALSGSANHAPAVQIPNVMVRSTAPVMNPRVEIPRDDEGRFHQRDSRVGSTGMARMSPTVENSRRASPAMNSAPMRSSSPAVRSGGMSAGRVSSPSPSFHGGGFGGGGRASAGANMGGGGGHASSSSHH